MPGRLDRWSHKFLGLVPELRGLSDAERNLVIRAFFRDMRSQRHRFPFRMWLHVMRPMLVLWVAGSGAFVLLGMFIPPNGAANVLGGANPVMDPEWRMYLYLAVMGLPMASVMFYYYFGFLREQLRISRASVLEAPPKPGGETPEGGG